MTVPPEAITVKAQAAKAMRDAAGEHCGWTPSLKLCMVLYGAAAPLIAAAERDRCIKIVTDLADHYDAIEMHAWANEHRKIADLLRGDQP